MNKKKLPKAIRPTIINKIRPELDPVASEHIRKVPQSAKARKRSRKPATVVTEIPHDDRRAAAIKLVERFTFWSGAAGLIPVPFADLAAVGGLQIQMLRRISQIYGVPFSKNRGKAFVAGLAGTMIPASTGIGIASLMKGVPMAGTAIGAFVAPTLAGGATYVIGMAFVEHFASGGTLLNFNPPDYREFIKNQLELRASARTSSHRSSHIARREGKARV